MRFLVLLDNIFYNPTILFYLEKSCFDNVIFKLERILTYYVKRKKKRFCEKIGIKIFIFTFMNLIYLLDNSDNEEIGNKAGERFGNPSPTQTGNFAITLSAS